MSNNSVKHLNWILNYVFVLSEPSISFNIILKLVHGLWYLGIVVRDLGIIHIRDIHVKSKVWIYEYYEDYTVIEGQVISSIRFELTVLIYKCAEWIQRKRKVITCVSFSSTLFCFQNWLNITFNSWLGYMIVWGYIGYDMIFSLVC